MRPLFPWTGTKRHLARRLLAGINPRRILEPFAGGASLYFHAERPGVLIDANTHLISLYQDLRDRPAEFLRAIERHVKATCSDHYYRTRALFNRGSYDGPPGATVLYLIAAGRNGLWRVDSNGALNTPYGARPRLSISHATLLRASELLSTSTLIADDWSTVVTRAEPGPGDLVYFDPPYSRGFNSYTVDPFTAWEHLADVAWYLRRLGCFVAVSNYQSRIDNLFQGWNRRTIPVTVRHNPTAPRRTLESLLLSYPSLA